MADIDISESYPTYTYECTNCDWSSPGPESDTFEDQASAHIRETNHVVTRSSNIFLARHDNSEFWEE